MEQATVDHENLGQKHRNYNKLLKELIDENKKVSEIKHEAIDIENLLKIDVASYNRDLDYILQILQSEDMLYVSRALSKSTWLITDQQYAHIVNPEHINTQLLPVMTTKAYVKFIKHIRHNIKDESRAEDFYSNEKKPTDAVKWLPYCSVLFIESNITKHIGHLQLKLFKRICAKSITIFKVIFKELPYYEKKNYAKAVNFFLNTDVDKYLDVIEDEDISSNYKVKFSAKSTELIMKQSPKRVIDNFEKYAKYIDIETFTKYLSADEVKSFLYAQAKKDCSIDEVYAYLRTLFTIDCLKYFIKRLPKHEQFNFVKQLFINKTETDENVTTENEINMKRLSHTFHTVCGTHTYVWYEFAPFEEAFEAITTLISMDLKDKHRHGTTFTRLSTLIKCASRNLENVKTLLKYYIDGHKTLTPKYNLDFVIKLLNRTKIYKYDESAWIMLNELLKSLKLYDDSNDDYNKRADICIHSIIIYYVLNDQKVPEVIEKQLSFDTLKKYRTKVNQEQNEKLFRYLYEYLLRNLQDPIKNEEDLSQTIDTLNNIGKLFKDWDKNLLDYPFVLDKIKEIIKIKEENFWKKDLSSLYINNKTWRKHMFEESLVLHPNEEVCLNALKHDPQLLTRHGEEMSALKLNDSVSLRRLLIKVRVYWPNLVMEQWVNIYLQKLGETTGQKAAVRGLCITLPREPLLDIISKYKPEKSKVDWNEVDDRIFTVQQLLAKNMHLARPQPSPDIILSYAKGDYLKFALPSLLAIFHNITLSQCQKYIPVLLDSPVSVQKHGIRFAYHRLDQESVKNIFINCWKKSKNASIRVIIFTFTYKLLSNEKDDSKATALWEILEVFFDNLTFVEDKKIYNLLSNVEKIPLIVRGNFLIKSYKFLLNLITNVKETSDRQNYEMQKDALVRYSREIMETINQDFVTELIDEFSTQNSNDIIPVISSYLLCAKDEDTQNKKYEKVLVPLMQQFQTKWEEKRAILVELLTRISTDLKEYTIEKHMVIPVSMFISIQKELEKFLSISENYVILTRWKLVVAFTKLIKESCADVEYWNDICSKVAPEFGKICLDYLKVDVTTHFPCIYVLFSKILERFLNDLCVSDSAALQIHHCLISDADFIQGYLATIEINHRSATAKDEIYKPLWQKLSSHPSIEVKMHFYNRIGRKVLEVQ